MIQGLSSTLAVIAGNKTISGLEKCFLQEKCMASNLAWSKTMPFRIAQASILANVSWILVVLVTFFEVLAVKRPSSTY